MNDDNKNINNENEEGGETAEQEEIVSEEDENTPRLLSKLREKVKKLETEKQENLNGWQRERADFVNFRKRSEEEKRELVKFANEALIGDIIPVLESFEMAFSNRKAWESLPEEWRKGVEYIYNQLLSALKNKGLEELNPPKGEKFDPNFHTAESFASTLDKEEDGVIMRVVKKGYRLNGRVINPSIVVVAEHKGENSENAGGK
ncbi:MAG: Protein GrpE [Parcubacteria group bacterium GW2011_GWA1_40_21]|nr:MAG: Protein GrpE [Parcubacteria group bacterium GW2011_GWC1_40_13]KKR53734.1 MAG: Protein GrpE [Parcubacteria group bacterium GW2011_GWA1_40_21]